MPRPERTVNTTEELWEVLKEVTMTNSALDFKWRFMAEDLCLRGGGRQGWLVQVWFERPDTETGVISTGKSRNEIVYTGATESAVVKTCWLLLELTIRHELMEGFRWKGLRIFNPHNTVGQLAAVQMLRAAEERS